jgi:hypothetical protein
MRAQRAWPLIAMAACSVRTPCSGGTKASDVADQACTAWATHYCERLAFCAPLSVEIAYGDVARCVERNKPACSTALRANGTGQSPSRLERCAEAYDSTACEDVVVAKPPLACNVPGSLGAGETCVDNSQCSGANAYCRMAIDETCGTCSVLGAVGAGCFSDRDCEYGLVCYFTCLAPVASGDPCDGMARQCPATLVCFNYRCSPPSPADAPCDARADNCDRDHGLFCDPQSKVCSHYTVADVGAPCGTGTTCRAGSCATNPATAKSTCVANAADREACDPAAGPFCMAPARCVEGTCRLLDSTSCR